MRLIRQRKAFTFIEVLVVVGVLIMLAGVVYAAYSGNLPAVGDKARCLSNMRSLHTSFSAYLQANNHWPQEPEDLTDPHAIEDWWIETMESYGATEEVWMCPTIKRNVTSKSENARPKMHYAPTLFDAHPFTPYKWKTQPWLIEIGDSHGRGGHIMFPDGSIQTMEDIVPGFSGKKMDE